MPLTAGNVLQFRRQVDVGHPLPEHLPDTPVDLVQLRGRILEGMDFVMGLDHPDLPDQGVASENSATGKTFR